MNFFSTRISILFAFILIGFYHPANASNSPVYEQRKLNYINNALTNFSSDAITLQAFTKVPVDSATLNSLLLGVSTGATSDFDIVKLVRILYLDTLKYDSKILPVLNAVPFWITKRDTVRNYWSENHMIMWMSSDWLLHEKYGKAIDNGLDARLRHFLRLKVKYGFYEFFSSVYSPYCLSGLINLADFAKDAEIKDLATQASQSLLKRMLQLTNDKGVYYPTAGRNYNGKYDTPYDQNHNNLIYLLTGFGTPPTSTSHAGAFLASSTLPVDTITNSWVQNLDTTYMIGHSLDTALVINKDMNKLDKVIFQWSFGGYFHPYFAEESSRLLTDSALWDQVDFAQVKALSIIPPESVQQTAEQLGSISKSSVICGEQVVIYKHKSVTLSSVQDFWKGKAGYQQFPCVANVGTTPVYTATGKVNKDWDKRNPNNANDNLPYVKQKQNLALLMYRPEPKSAIIKLNNPEVALRFNDADFDEVKTDSMWLIGRQGNGYVGIRRSCLGYIDSVRACDIPNGQTWVIMVGDSETYGGFANFQTKINQSQFTEKWYYDSVAKQTFYYSKIVVDTNTIEYAWGVDSVQANGIADLNHKGSLNIYPNPANDRVNIDLSSLMNQAVTIKVKSLIGQDVFSERMANVSSTTKSINTSNWQQGIYIISVENQDKVFTQKLVKKE